MMSRLRVRKLIGDRKGATAAEYALILALLAVAVIGAFRTVGTSLGSTLNNASAAAEGAPPPGIPMDSH